MEGMSPELLAALARGMAPNGASVPPDLMRMAQMLQGMELGALAQQDETDRRWRNMNYAADQRKARGQVSRTGADHHNLLVEFGMQPNQPLPRSAMNETMHFGQFMERCGRYGYTLMERYTAQSLPDAPSCCDYCKSRDHVDMRCSQCGEYYCNTDCQRKDWKNHREVCEAASITGDGRRMPPLMTADRYAEVKLGKAPQRPAPTPPPAPRPAPATPAAAQTPPATATHTPIPTPTTAAATAAAANVSHTTAQSSEQATGGTATAAAQQGGSSSTKNARKIAKKKAKKEAARTAQAQGNQGEGGTASTGTILPAQHQDTAGHQAESGDELELELPPPEKPYAWELEQQGGQ